MFKNLSLNCLEEISLQFYDVYFLCRLFIVLIRQVLLNYLYRKVYGLIIFQYSDVFIRLGKCDFVFRCIYFLGVFSHIVYAFTQIPENSQMKKKTSDFSGHEKI